MTKNMNIAVLSQRLLSKIVAMHNVHPFSEKKNAASIP